MRLFAVITIVSSVCALRPAEAQQQHSSKPHATSHATTAAHASSPATTPHGPVAHAAKQTATTHPTAAPAPCKTVVPTPVVTPVATPLTAAQLRTDPAGTKGKTVQWTVRVFALENADPLRRGLAADEPYWLASGPGKESAVMYIAIPPALLSNARALASLAPAAVSVVATVRNGRSDPAGVPILDAVSFTRQ